MLTNWPGGTLPKSSVNSSPCRCMIFSPHDHLLAAPSTLVHSSLTKIARRRESLPGPTAFHAGPALVAETMSQHGAERPVVASVGRLGAARHRSPMRSPRSTPASSNSADTIAGIPKTRRAGIGPIALACSSARATIFRLLVVAEIDLVEAAAVRLAGGGTRLKFAASRARRRPAVGAAGAVDERVGTGLPGAELAGPNVSLGRGKRSAESAVKAKMMAAGELSVPPRRGNSRRRPSTEHVERLRDPHFRRPIGQLRGTGVAADDHADELLAVDLEADRRHRRQRRELLRPEVSSVSSSSACSRPSAVVVKTSPPAVASTPACSGKSKSRCAATVAGHRVDRRQHAEIGMAAPA